jgi:hypothetical protein
VPELLTVRKVRATTIGKKRRGPTLDREETGKALAFVREICAKQRYPVKFLAYAMGCSLKTAGRILASKRPYTTPLKRAYMVSFSSYVGCPLEVITQPMDLDYVAALEGWQSVSPASLATKVASALGAGMATRSMCVFSMPADFTVMHGPDGRPASVRVDVTAEVGRRERHSLLVAESGFAGGLLLTHLDEARNQRGQVTPSADAIDRILKSIKNEQKNHTTKRVS